MDLHLKGKKALVTGGTRGIGLAIVESLLKEEVHVAFCARHKDEVNATANRLKRNDVNIIGDAVDVAAADSFTKWIDRAGLALDGIDILVLNAAAMVAENTEKDWYANFNVDLMGAVRAIATAKPYLEKAAKINGDASLVLISSVSAVEAYSMTSYGPIKAALIHLAKGFAKEGGRKLIRANVVSPGPIYFENGYWHQIERNDPETFKKVLKKVPLNRLGTPQDIANAVIFLASPVSSYVNGSNLIVDGAYTSRVDF